MISARLDGRYTPEEWSAILTRGDGEGVVQFCGHGMKPQDAIARALANAGVEPCPD